MANCVFKMAKSVSILACCAALAAPSQAAQPPVLRELSAQWWQWALSIPASTNPLSELTGGTPLCMLGQRGPIWFLGGTLFTGGVVERNCSVPEGTSLFFPLANSVQFNTPDICGQVGPLDVPQLRAFAAGFVDGVTSTSVTLDGKPVKTIDRIRSVVFATTLPDANVFVPLCAPLPIPAAVYSPSVDDGIYAYVDKLKTGSHTLRFTANNPTAGYTLDMTYHLDVVPVTKR